MNAAVKPRLRDGLTVAHLDGEAVIYDDDTGRIHHLNPSATAILVLCDGRSTPEDIASDVADIFDVQAETVLPELLRLLEQLRELGLLAEAGADDTIGHDGRNER
ncbi:MAG: HPr-rel-A system PqqD family peptide chaperone [Actinomycetota bacterium]